MATSQFPIPTIETSPAAPAGLSPLPSRRSIRLSSGRPSPEHALSTSPYRPPSIFGVLSADRNSEESHIEALAAAQAEHERVRNAAIRAFELHELRVEHQRILEEQQKQEARIKAEQKIVEEEKRLKALRAHQVPRPPPEPARPAPSAAAPAVAAAAAAPAPAPAQTNNAQPSQVSKPAAAAPAAQPPQQPPAQPKPSPLGGPLNPPNASPLAAASAAPKPVAAPVQQPPAQTRGPAAKDRYSEIHAELKKLRRALGEQAKLPGSPLQTKLGDMRRLVRRAVGQLTTEKSANLKTTARLLELLRSAQSGAVPSPPIDVTNFLVEPREPVPGGTQNDPNLPSLFVYLVNIFAKSVIRQFIDECGANPAAADPIGVATASVFSQADFQWRGKSLIDILMAKFRIACPVLFGQRGKDTTEQGRISIGWRREAGAWVPEQTHNDRMTGLGAGYAAIALRKFGRVARQNPYPPSNYWRAMAFILNTPPNEVSATQYIVLKAMIQGYEERFLEFFGSAALAALRFALVDFPQRAPPKALSQAKTLSVLGDVLRKDRGLALPV